VALATVGGGGGAVGSAATTGALAACCWRVFAILYLLAQMPETQVSASRALVQKSMLGVTEYGRPAFSRKYFDQRVASSPART
jgi:hypothetical protein